MLELNLDQYLELEKIAVGAFAPLTGFMDEDQFWSCARRGRLPDGAVFPIPILFDISAALRPALRTGSALELAFRGVPVGKLYPSSVYRPDRREAAQLVFGTDTAAHPGVAYFYSLAEYFVGGVVELHDRAELEFSSYEKTPAQTREHFRALGWRSIVGFQTRNAPHRAHEYLQKAALELCDGILIQPLVGRKKVGDFHPRAILAGYEALLQHYYPPRRALLTVLSTVMRYAGPREALFHAIVRRNYGCTHFIVGRDHAGVDGFYEKYAAHSYLEQFDSRELGITVLPMRGPYLCRKCDAITTDKTCPHGDTAEYTHHISGTEIRRMLEAEAHIDPRVMRAEVVQAIRRQANPFIE